MRSSEVFAFNTILESQSVRAEKVITAVEPVTDSQVNPPNLGRIVDVRV